MNGRGSGFYSVETGWVFYSDRVTPRVFYVSTTSPPCPPSHLSACRVSSSFPSIASFIQLSSHFFRLWTAAAPPAIYYSSPASLFLSLGIFRVAFVVAIFFFFSFLLLIFFCSVPFRFDAISDLDVYKVEPWDLPDFYNWNRVKIRYCDGGSFAGDEKFDNGTLLLYFRGQRIWQAIIEDLLPKGLESAKKALLSGCSAGGLASYLHCNNFTSYLLNTTAVKCLGDAGFYLDSPDITMNYTQRTFFQHLVTLQGIEKNLDENCTSSISDPKQCIFPQYMLKYITSPFFILNSAYDVYQGASPRL